MCLVLVRCVDLLFFFNDTAPTEIYTLSLHDALPILIPGPPVLRREVTVPFTWATPGPRCGRSEERFSRNAETDIVCRLLLGKKETHRHPSWAAPRSPPADSYPSLPHTIP